MSSSTVTELTEDRERPLTAEPLGACGAEITDSARWWRDHVCMYPIAPASKGKPSVPKHRGAAAVAAVFLTVAGVVFGLGIVAAVALGLHADRHLGDSVGISIGYALAVALGGVFLASLLAFFGHVLDLLTEIAENTHS
jgi:hypothetical protein